MLLLPDPQAAPSVTRPAESTTAPARLVRIRGLVIGLLFGEAFGKRGVAQRVMGGRCASRPQLQSPG